MRNFLFSVALVLASCTSLFAQHVKLPAEIKGQVGAWIVIVPESKDGGEPKWKVGPGLSLVPLDRLFPGQKAAGIVVQAAKEGVYEVWAWNAKGDVASDLAVCKVVVGNPPDPGPDPGPGPTPPKPGTNPFAPETAFKALIIYESVDDLPPKQRAILVATDVRNFLKSKGTDCYRFLDKDANVSQAAAWIQTGMRRNRTAVPWIVIGNGSTGFEGPLPTDIAETIKLLQKYGG